MDQAVQIGAAILLLAGFGLEKLGILDARSPLYLVLNTFGSAILACDALTAQEWGFLTLEGTWALISTVGLARAAHHAVRRAVRTSAEFLGPSRNL